MELVMIQVLKFLFPRHLHRLEYLIRGVLIEVLGSFWYANSTLVSEGWWWLLSFTLTVYTFCFLILPRLRDAAMSTWWLLAIPFPPLNLGLSILLIFRAPAFLQIPPHQLSTQRPTQLIGLAGAGN